MRMGQKLMMLMWLSAGLVKNRFMIMKKYKIEGIKIMLYRKAAVIMAAFLFIKKLVIIIVYRK